MQDGIDYQPDVTTVEELGWCKEAFYDCGFHLMQKTQQFEKLEIAYTELKTCKENDKQQYEKEKNVYEFALKAYQQNYLTYYRESQDNYKLSQSLAEKLEKVENEKKTLTEKLVTKTKLVFDLEKQRDVNKLLLLFFPENSVTKLRYL